jgi:hypothetical protein
MTTGSSMQAMTLAVPPQTRHLSTSISPKAPTVGATEGDQMLRMAGVTLHPQKTSFYQLQKLRALLFSQHLTHQCSEHANIITQGFVFFWKIYLTHNTSGHFNLKAPIIAESQNRGQTKLHAPTSGEDHIGTGISEKD